MKDVLKRLKRRAPRARFVWIMGGDNLAQFHRWRRWKEIARLVPIAVVSRPDRVYGEVAVAYVVLRDDLSSQAAGVVVRLQIADLHADANPLAQIARLHRLQDSFETPRILRVITGVVVQVRGVIDNAYRHVISRSCT